MLYIRTTQKALEKGDQEEIQYKTDFQSIKSVKKI